MSHATEKGKGTYMLRRSNSTWSFSVVTEWMMKRRDLKLGSEENRAKHSLMKFQSFGSNRLGKKKTWISLRDRKYGFSSEIRGNTYWEMALKSCFLCP